MVEKLLLRTKGIYIKVFDAFAMLDKIVLSHPLTFDSDPVAQFIFSDFEHDLDTDEQCSAGCN